MPAMLIQILAHTPPWVFGLFLALVALGVAQTRPRQVARARLALLPLAMTTLALLGVWSSFADHAVALAAWTTTMLGVVGASLAWAPPRMAAYSPASKRYAVPGSWIPLALMMGIFFTKYAVAVVRAMQPAALDGTAAITAVCALYGLYSGLFLARALRIARTAWRDGGAAPGAVVSAPAP
jgi:hypothetical protein